MTSKPKQYKSSSKYCRKKLSKRKFASGLQVREYRGLSLEEMEKIEGYMMPSEQLLLNKIREVLSKRSKRTKRFNKMIKKKQQV